ncbi:nucleoside phosphorylase domain-containing protein [Xylaria venustula]|nr:nucleoside phosphorylase domain-containing protein [Xylaria venustula]
MLSEPSTQELFSGKDETEILRQLAIQALRHVPNFKSSFIIDILCLFKQCASSYDWFRILKHIFELIREVYVVIDLNLLGHRINQAKNWPNEFSTLISQLGSSCSSKLGIMILSSRLLAHNPNVRVVLVDSPSKHSHQKASSKSQPTNYIRELSTILSTNERENSQARRNEIPALREHHGDTPISITSARSDSSGYTRTSDHTSSNQQGNDETPRETFASILPAANPPILPHRNEIAIAIICALPLEADAVMALFDHHWDIQLFGNTEGDKNAYSVGKIGCHNVVLVHMPGMGRTPAATVATSCRASFPGIMLALVVGICGAVPFDRRSTEVVLGDVVISDRLVIYDFGRQFPDKFMRKEETHDSARKPPEAIRNFLSKMKARIYQNMLRNRTGLHLETLIRSGYPAYPGVTEHRLFEPSYRHKHQDLSACTQCASSAGFNGSVCDEARISTCDTLGCDLAKLVARRRHSHIIDSDKDWLPAIHFGAYASGDRVMKSGEHRDQIADREKVIAFEMEGAGVWEIFPCIIIKGVCDYADSHKNKKWQDYAAITAAASLKAFLEVWPARISTSNSGFSS